MDCFPQSIVTVSGSNGNGAGDGCKRTLPENISVIRAGLCLEIGDLGDNGYVVYNVELKNMSLHFVSDVYLCIRVLSTYNHPDLGIGKIGPSCAPILHFILGVLYPKNWA